MKELLNQLSNIEKDAAYKVIEVLKDGMSGKTEKVLSLQDGQIYVRKYFCYNMAIAEDDFYVLAKLSHPYLPKTHESYTLADRQVLIQEYISGMALSEVIQYADGLTPRRAVDIALQLCEIAEFLHKQTPKPIIHRDIKPDNIICA